MPITSSDLNMGKSAPPEQTVADISMIVPNYNNGRFLPAFFESVMQSTMLPAELILIDDGSTDDSISILSKYSGLPFLKIVKLPENRGLPAALNAGLDRAGFRYIMRADPDDILEPERIRRQYEYMETHTDVDVLGTNVLYFSNRTGEGINISNFPATHEEIVRLLRAGYNGIQHPTVLIRASSLQRNRYPDFCPGEDYHLFSTLAKNGCRFASLSEPLYRMRVHEASFVSTLTLLGVKQIFSARERIWGTKTSHFRIFTYYMFIHFYRKSQLEENILLRINYLAIAGLFYPQRVIKALFRK